MATTRATLVNLDDHMLESMGQWTTDRSDQLSPAPHPKDASRRPVRGYGQVDVAEVTSDPDQPRTQFTQESLERLAQSIHEQGQLAPIRVRWSDELSKWMIIVGERRWRASQLAGLERIDCFFHEGPLTRAEILEQQLRAFVATGQYDGEGDVIYQAFEALNTQEELDDFRKSIAESREQAAQGEAKPINLDAVMTRLHDRLSEQG